MRKILVIFLVLIGFTTQSQELKELYLRERLILRDSSVNYISTGDTLTTKEWVRSNALITTGNNTEIFFNDNGALGASSNFTWNDITLNVNSGTENIFIGTLSGGNITTGNFNTLNGYNSGFTNESGSSNTFMGTKSGYSNFSGGANIFMGRESGYSNSTGSNNTYLGYQSGKQATGGSNIFVGYLSGFSESSSNKLYIENSSSSTPLIYGDFAEDSVRINGILGVKEKINLDSTEQSYSEGALYYDKDLKALTFYNDLSDFTHQLGYEHVARYYNNTGSTINDGTLLTPVGQKINGEIIPTVQIAGNGAVDSLKLVAMSTTTTLDGEFGVVTLLGAVNNLDLSAYSDNDFIYVGHDGDFTNVSPSPPEYSLLIGKVFYADNDSGQLYMMPGNIDFTPSPHVGADTSRASFAITINTQNVFEYIPIGSADVQDNHGFTVTGDSIQPQVAGSYTIVLSMSFQGNPTAETWRYGMFINNIEEYTKSRSTSSSDNGDVNVPATRFLDTTDWVSFRITNESGTGNPTVIDLGYEFIFLHE